MITPIFTTSRGRLLAIGIVALVQTAALAWMIGDRVRLLKTGREIVLPVVPVDPRDLFRGDYVTLSYDISRIQLAADLDTKPIRETPYFVVLEKSPDGAWTAARTGEFEPGPLAPGEVLLKGTLDRTFGWASGRRWRVAHFGIEKYFVPEGTGRQLEQAARDKKLAAVIAVDASGRAAIKGLVVDGKVRYEEPLF